jgi:tellurite resistance protein TehA-like permease
MIIPVGNLVVALAASNFTANTDFAFLWFGTGFLFWIVLLVLTLQRLMFGGPVPDAMRFVDRNFFIVPSKFLF